MRYDPSCVSRFSVGEWETLPDDIERLKSLVFERDLEIQQLREYVRLLKSQRFGAASERVHRDQLGLFNEAEQLVDTSDAPVKPLLIQLSRVRYTKDTRPASVSGDRLPPYAASRLPVV